MLWLLQDYFNAAGLEIPDQRKNFSTNLYEMGQGTQEWTK